MADSVLFKGFKQVTKATYSATTDCDKVGYIFFVRDEDSNETSIYFGDKLYGGTNKTFEELVNQSLSITGEDVMT